MITLTPRKRGDIFTFHFDAQDWPAIYAEAKRDMAEAIRQLRQERAVCPEWLWEPMI